MRVNSGLLCARRRLGGRREFTGTSQRMKRYTKSGSPGHGWYEKYKKFGPDSFRRWERPKPFDFDAADAQVLGKRTYCFFDIGVAESKVGRIEFELLDELLPVTCENFKLLCSGSAPSGFRYKGSHFIRLMARGAAIMGGDVATAGGSHSAWKQRYYADEGFFVPHSQAGILSSANAGIDTNGSQFYITLKECPHMDGRCVAFGRVATGYDVITGLIKDVYMQRGIPTKSITILDAGLAQNPHASSIKTSSSVHSPSSFAAAATAA